MKKRLIALMLVLCTLFTCMSPVCVAAEEIKLEPNYDRYASFMKWEAEGCFEGRLYAKTLNALSKYDQMLDVASALVGENLSEERCMMILAHVVTMTNYAMESWIVERAEEKAEALLDEYEVNADKLAAGSSAAKANFLEAQNAVIQEIEESLGVRNGTLGVIVNTVAEMELLIQLHGDYMMQQDFLKAVYDYSEIKNMREAAYNLKASNKEIMLHKLSAFRGGTSATAKYEAYDVFLDETANEFAKKPGTLKLEAKAAMPVLNEVYAAYTGNWTDWESLVKSGDTLFTVCDMYNRYNEMKALKDFHDALFAAVKENAPSGSDDHAVMNQNIDLMNTLLYVDARGEYCARQLMTTDGKLAEKTTFSNGKSVKQNYDQSLDMIEDVMFQLNNLYDEVKQQATDKNLSIPGTEPVWIGEGTPTISILMKKADHVTDYVNNSYTKRLEKDGNVKIAFEWLPAAERELAIRMKMLSGEELPMVLNYGLNISAAKDYADIGTLVNLAPYIESGVAHYTLQNDVNNPELYLLANITTAEGAIYGLPKYNAALSNETKFKLWINIEWLKNLGIKREDIKTTDDFLTVMRRFKNEDANGNGDKNDEIPFMPTTDFGGTAYKFLTNAFVYEGDDDMFQIVDGKVTTSYLQDGWYKAADFIKQLVDEKLLPVDGFTTNQNALKALQANAAAKNGGCPVIGASTRSTNGIFKANNDYDFRLQYAALSPLKASADQKETYAAYTLTASQGHWYVTKDAGVYEQLCVRIGDLQQQEKYYIQGRFGDEGVNWMTKDEYLTKVKSGTWEAQWEELKTTAAETYNIHNLEKDDLSFVSPYGQMGIKGEYYWFNDVWSDENACTWYDSAPTFSGVTESKGAQLQHTFQFGVSNLYRQCEATIAQQNLMRTSSLICPPLAFTDDEIDELGTIKADIQSFLRKERVLYYTGNDCQLSKGKESFINELNKMGLERMLKIYNRAYMRQYG